MLRRTYFIYSNEQVWSLSSFYQYHAFSVPSDLLQEHKMLLHFFHFPVCNSYKNRQSVISTVLPQPALPVLLLLNCQLPFSPLLFLASLFCSRILTCLEIWFFQSTPARFTRIHYQSCLLGYYSNSSCPKPLQVIISIVSSCSIVSFIFVYSPNLFYSILLFLCIKAQI